MKFQLRGCGWSVDGGRHFVPEGAIVDTSEAGWAALMARNGSMPPPNSMPMDQQTWDLMRTQYEAYLIFTNPSQDGIIRR
jgi:hypothetical protein